jgi:hypothetical protein
MNRTLPKAVLSDSFGPSSVHLSSIKFARSTQVILISCGQTNQKSSLYFLSFPFTFLDKCNLSIFNQTYSLVFREYYKER